MRSARWLFSLLWLIVLFHMPSAFAMQWVAPFPTPSDYSIEIPGKDGRPSYHEVPAARDDCAVLINDLKRISGWQRPPDQTNQPNSILLKFRRVDDAIKAVLSLLYPVGKFQVVPLDDSPTVNIATYTLRLGESATLQELARFGIEPFEIKVVSATSHTIAPSHVNNLTKFVEVVRIDKARSHYRISFKNKSSKNILALRFFYPTGQATYGNFPQFHLKPLIAPGDIYQHDFYNPPWSDVTYYSGGPGKGAPLEFTVVGVVFDDFTFEGEKEDALEIAAFVRARQILVPRMISLFKDAETTYKHDKQRALNRLKIDAAALNTEPEFSVIAHLVKRLSPLTENEMSRLIHHLKNQMSKEKRDLLERIDIGEYLERKSGGYIEGSANREHWLTMQSNGSEKYLRALSSMNLLP